MTIQDLGWQSGGRYLPLMDDISSVAYWYQTEPHKPFPKLPDKDHLRDQLMGRFSVAKLERDGLATAIPAMSLA